MNQAWVDYGNDFGSNQKPDKFCKLKNYLQEIKNNGGNTVRVWVHVEGDHNPQYDYSGNVIATDSSHTLIRDMKNYALAAQDLDIFVIFNLWNGAVLKNQTTIAMLKSDAKLNTYIKKALIPMVQGLKGIPSVAGWEIFNEPELSVIPGQYNSEPCFDTRRLSGSGAGWAGQTFTM